VVTLPLNCVVPPVFVVKLVAITLLNVVVPMLFALIFPKLVISPTLFVNVIFPLLTSRVKSLSPLTLPLNNIFPDVPVFKLELAPRVTSLVKVIF